MILLLGEPEDDDILWLAAALHQRGEAVELVIPADLLVGSRLTFRIDGDGTSSSVRLRDGRSLEQDSPGLVVNRLHDLAPPPTGTAADAAYLGEEWRAALTAWLRTLRCPVLNPPRAASPGGPWFPTPAWCAIARAHGLPSAPWTSQESSEVVDPVEILCVGGRCLDSSESAPATVQTRLCRMSMFAGAPLLGARFDRGRDWRFVTATAFPPLAPAGPPLVDALVRIAHDGTPA